MPTPIYVITSLFWRFLMQTLRLSFSLPDANHSEMELHLSADEADCEFVIALPARTRVAMAQPAVVNVHPVNAVNDEYELGGYAGI
jgi:hypothetical protein